jgi:hypothetical protein
MSLQKMEIPPLTELFDVVLQQLLKNNAGSLQIRNPTQLLNLACQVAEQISEQQQKAGKPKLSGAEKEKLVLQQLGHLATVLNCSFSVDSITEETLQTWIRTIIDVWNSTATNGTNQSWWIRLCQTLTISCLRATTVVEVKPTPSTFVQGPEENRESVDSTPSVEIETHESVAVVTEIPDAPGAPAAAGTGLIDPVQEARF